MALDGWSYYTTATITGSTDGEVLNNILRVTIQYQSFMNSDFSDIRFCAGDGSTLLNHNIITYTSQTSAVFDVMIPSIPANPSTYTLYIYAGNSSATDVSNPKAVYTDFDNFDDNTLDTSLWTTNTPVGAVAETGNALQITIPSGSNGNWSGSTGNAPVCYVTFPNGDFIANVKVESGTVNVGDGKGIFLSVDRLNKYNLEVVRDSGAQRIYLGKTINGTDASVTNISTTTQPVWLQIRKVGTTYYFEYKFNLTDSFTTLSTVTSLGITPNKIGLLGRNWSPYPALTSRFNDFKVYPTTANPPTMGTLGSWSTTTSTSLSVDFPASVSVISYGGILIEDSNGLILSELDYIVQRGSPSGVQQIKLVNQSSMDKTVTLTPSTSTIQQGTAVETYNAMFLSSDGISYVNSLTITVPASSTKTVYTKYSPPDNSVPGSKEWKLASSQQYNLPFTMPTGWTFVNIIPITGSTDGAYTNALVTVQIPFVGTVMNADYSDIRFYTIDGTQISYQLTSVVGGSGTFKLLIPSLPGSPAVTKLFVIAGNEDATTTSTRVTGNTPTTAPSIGSLGAWNYYGSLECKADVQYTKQEIEGLDYTPSFLVKIGGVEYE